MYAPEDKDPPEVKELPNLFGLYILKVIPSSSWSIASCNADVTKMLKQAKHSYTKLTPAQRCEIYKFSTLQAHCNSTIIYYYQREQNLAQFVKVLLINFLTCFIRQISSDFSTVKVLHYTVAYDNQQISHGMIYNFVCMHVSLWVQINHCIFAITCTSHCASLRLAYN